MEKKMLRGMESHWAASQEISCCMENVCLAFINAAISDCFFYVRPYVTTRRKGKGPPIFTELMELHL